MTDSSLWTFAFKDEKRIFIFHFLYLISSCRFKNKLQAIFLFNFKERKLKFCILPYIYSWWCFLSLTLGGGAVEKILQFVPTSGRFVTASKKNNHEKLFPPDSDMDDETGMYIWYYFFWKPFQGWVVIHNDKVQVQETRNFNQPEGGGYPLLRLMFKAKIMALF